MKIIHKPKLQPKLVLINKTHKGADHPIRKRKEIEDSRFFKVRQPTKHPKRRKRK